MAAVHVNHNFVMKQSILDGFVHSTALVEGIFFKAVLKIYNWHEEKENCQEGEKQVRNVTDHQIVHRVGYTSGFSRTDWDLFCSKTTQERMFDELEEVTLSHLQGSKKSISGWRFTKSHPRSRRLDLVGLQIWDGKHHLMRWRVQGLYTFLINTFPGTLLKMFDHKFSGTSVHTMILIQNVVKLKLTYIEYPQICNGLSFI